MGWVKIGADDGPIKMVNLHATSCTCCRLARGQPSVLIHNVDKDMYRFRIAVSDAGVAIAVTES
jgi:hypothetical protein